jgi:hypothetical protein
MAYAVVLLFSRRCFTRISGRIFPGGRPGSAEGYDAFALQSKVWGVAAPRHLKVILRGYVWR